MINVILSYKSLNGKEQILELFEYRGNMLCFAGIPLYSGSVSFTWPPFKASFSLQNFSDIECLRETCSAFDNVDIVFEATTDNK